MAAPWKLGMFQSAGPMGMWKLPENRSTDYLDLEYWVTMARRCEQAGVDFLFLADDYGYPIVDDAVPPAAIRGAIQFPKADPMAILPALAAVTDRLGLAVTLSTMVEKPPMVARKLATLDHLTRGRIGWNIVTGAGQNASARLFGIPLTDHDKRYEIATDHVDLSLKLWEGSWDDDGLAVDRERGVFADPDKVHYANYEGKYVRTRGPLSIPRSAQGRPVLMQAGSSDRGRAFAARWAEVIFTAQRGIGDMRDFAADIRDRMQARGRAPGDCAILPAISVVLGETESIARERAEYLHVFSRDHGCPSNRGIAGTAYSK